MRNHKIRVLVVGAAGVLIASTAATSVGSAVVSAGTAATRLPVNAAAHRIFSRPARAAGGPADNGLGAEEASVSLHDAAPKPPTAAQCRKEFSATCTNPGQLETAFDTKPLIKAGTDGTGETIDVVDSFGSPTLRADTDTFDSAFGLPRTKLLIDHPEGKIPHYQPRQHDEAGWALETTLDVDYAHAMAPGATIRVLETPNDETEGAIGLPQMMAAEGWALDKDGADVISQSFGATEPTFKNAHQLRSLRGSFKQAAKQDVTVLGASGDDGSTDLKKGEVKTYQYKVQSWPSADPLVTSVGGLSLHLTKSGQRSAPDSVWNDGYGAGGGGVSSVFPRPSWQSGVKSQVGSARGVPDISMLADVKGGALIYTSFRGTPQGWQLIGGTSLATPLFAGVIALADQSAGRDLGQINPALYAMGAGDAAVRKQDGLVDTTHGDNSYAGVQGYAAKPGWDLASGWGTVNATKFLPALIAADPAPKQ